MARRYHVCPLPPPGIQDLPGAVAHHLGAVLRRRPGDRVVLFDGRGQEACATLREVARGRVAAEVEPAVQVVREPRVRVTLAVALPKRSRAEWLFEHGTEVGVARFQPVVADRSALRKGNLERWQRIVAAAAGQCDRSLVPSVEPPLSLGAFLAASGEPAADDERWIADGHGPELGPAAREAATLLVGPEGGWTEQERADAYAAGFRSCSLGPLTLRTETAALAGAVRLTSASFG